MIIKHGFSVTQHDAPTDMVIPVMQILEVERRQYFFVLDWFTAANDSKKIGHSPGAPIPTANSCFG